MSRTVIGSLDRDFSEESDDDHGYDSEAAEVSKGGRSKVTAQNGFKRRKLSQSGSEDDEIGPFEPISQTQNGMNGEMKQRSHADETFTPGHDRIDSQVQASCSEHNSDDDLQKKSTPAAMALQKSSKRSQVSNKHNNKTKPGVLYLSSLPPYLKPSALRNLLEQRGFGPIARLFLTPASKAKTGSKKNSRQLYSEGWIEFASKKVARRCAETLNAAIVGGKKGGFYHDDLWNMKYLKGMAWDELMAGIREEKREQEGKREEERRMLAKETKRFIEGVEEGKRIDGIKRKRKAKQQHLHDNAADVDGTRPASTQDVKRSWRQFEAAGNGRMSATPNGQKMDDEVQDVLGAIF